MKFFLVRWDSMISQTLQNSVDPNMGSWKKHVQVHWNSPKSSKKPREWRWNVCRSFHEWFAAYVVVSRLCNPKRIGHHERGYDSKRIIYTHERGSQWCAPWKFSMAARIRSCFGKGILSFHLNPILGFNLRDVPPWSWTFPPPEKLPSQKEFFIFQKIIFQGRAVKLPGSILHIGEV